MKDALSILNEELPQAYQEKAPLFADFLQQLTYWNKTYNLTAIRKIEDMVPLHIIDCLSIIPCVQGSRILDVGTGAGFPGIPLAICMPELDITLVESNRKRIQFLQTIKHELRLNNVKIWQGRIEQYQTDVGFDTITSRAFSNLLQFMAFTKHLCAENGIWCAMKGHVPCAELAELSNPYEIYSYTIPKQSVARCCILIKNKE